MILKKLFQADSQSGPDTEIESHASLQRTFEEEYEALVSDQLSRGGINLACVAVEIRLAGNARDGLPVYACMLRLEQWERRSALRLLLGLPIFESKLRRLAQGSWLNDVSHFSGVWLHASEQLQSSSGLRELRALVMEIERGDAASTPDTGDVAGPWSLPTDLGKLP